MGILGSKLLKSGMVGGLAGMAADKAGVNIGDLAKNGYFGLTGLALAKKKRDEARYPRDEVRYPMGEEGSFGRTAMRDRDRPMNMKKGGKVKKMAKGGSTASKRADGCATKGKTKGKFV
jgi:hypothetical protein